MVMPAQTNLLFALVLMTALTLATLSRLQAQETDPALLRQEIEVIEKRLSEMEKGRLSVVEQMTDIDRKINLRARLVKELESQESESRKKARRIESRVQDLNRQIAELTAKLRVKESNLETLRQDVSARVNFIHRHRNLGKVTFLFGSRDLNDFFTRQRYLKAIEEFDRRQLNNLIVSRDEVAADRSSKEASQKELGRQQTAHLQELAEIQNLLEQRRVEEKQLSSEKSAKSKLLSQITDDKEILSLLLEERKKALERIGEEIRRLTQQPRPSQGVFSPRAAFTTLAGKLDWPIERWTIAQKFGENRDPKLKTTVYNPGVDVKAFPGDRVTAVSDGVVTSISYLRGFGNTVILSHNDGCYTVYARLGNIAVSEGEVINPGDLIGEVGETGVSSDFHFEIWVNRKEQDPLKWLRKRR